MELEIKAPSPDSPGFLYRTKRALLLQRALADKEINAEAIDQLVEYLLPFVVKPEKEADKKEALMQASQNQFMEMFNAVAGVQGDASSPQT